ncbi:cadmium resistance transporter [Weissella kandleri]|uniref:cadmium resistance transporter n=1 Tax=Weissella kandleri TaxID=1616 RepID=UPI00387EB963
MYLFVMASLFIGGDLDFFVILISMIKKYKFKNTLIGYILGVVLMFVISATAGQFIQRVLPMWSIGLLGFVPIYFGIRKEEKELKKQKTDRSSLKILLIYLAACGVDNLALFTPVLANLTIYQCIISGFFLVLLALITTTLAYYAGKIKIVELLFLKYGDGLIRLIYIGIGIFVMVDTGLISKVISLFN